MIVERIPGGRQVAERANGEPPDKPNPDAALLRGFNPDPGELRDGFGGPPVAG